MHSLLGSSRICYRLGTTLWSSASFDVNHSMASRLETIAILTTWRSINADTISPYSVMVTHCDGSGNAVWSTVTWSPKPVLEWRTWRGFDHPWQKSTWEPAEIRVRISLRAAYTKGLTRKPRLSRGHSWRAIQDTHNTRKCKPFAPRYIGFFRYVGPGPDFS